MHIMVKPSCVFNKWNRFKPKINNYLLPIVVMYKLPKPELQ